MSPVASPDQKKSPIIDIVVAVVTSVTMLALVAGISPVLELEEARLDAKRASGRVLKYH